MAVTGLAVAAEMGVRVPERLSTVAWRRLGAVPPGHPPLAAVNVDIPAYGSAAARRLLDLVSGDQETGSDCNATPVLVPRASTAPMPGL